MKYAVFFLACVIIVQVAFSQKRYLVSPNNDVIPLKRGESARTIIERATRQQDVKQKTSARLTSENRFGYPPDINPVEGTFLAFHKDVVAMWFVTPASGSVDSIFWVTGSSVGAQDSALVVRIMQSQINTQTGPGIPPYPPPGCVNWGYWASTNDPDQGLAPFADMATDPDWHSTVPGPVPSFPPFGSELWGLTGILVIDHANQVNSLAMSSIGVPLELNCGDAFFVTMRVKSPPCCHVDDGPTTWSYSTVNAPSPSRVWKFYEHQSPAECQGSFHQGWTARSLMNGDTVVPFVLNWWYVMTVDGDPGELTCPSDITVDATAGLCGAVVTYQPPTSSCGAVTCSPPPGSFFSVGTTPVICLSVSPLGDTISCSFNVIVRDQQSPTISVALNPTELWPPGHQLVQINATVNVADNCPGVSYVLSSVTSNESDNGLGDGDLPNDIQGASVGTADNTFSVRAERSAVGSGRVYTATYTATDASGNTTSASATVRVPRNLGTIAEPDHDAREIDNAPLTFRLGESYPNPFNPTTEVGFEIAEKSHVWLKVYNLIGKEVATLVDEDLPAGTYKRAFDASTLPSGIYVYRIMARAASQTFIDSKKMILMK